MPDVSKFFDSPWLKAGLNVKDGYMIRFFDVGTEESVRGSDDNQLVFLVDVIDKEDQIISRKKFSLNKGNFKVVSGLYGVNSDNWVGKEAQVNIVKKQNPKTGELVNSIALSAPNVDLEGNIDVE